MCTQSRIVRDIMALVEQGSFAEAADALATALDQYPDNGRLWWLRGVAAYHEADYNLARTALEHASLLVPLDGRTQCLLADAYARSGFVQESRNLLQVLADDPASGIDVLPFLAAGFGMLGDYEQALGMCRRAADYNPQDPQAHFGMAYYLQRLGYPPGIILPPATRAFELEPNQLLFRSSLAFLLSELGRHEEAYDLLRDVSVKDWPCACGLRRMKSLFQVMGDFGRWQECSERLSEIRAASDDGSSRSQNVSFRRRG